MIYRNVLGQKPEKHRNVLGQKPEKHRNVLGQKWKNTKMFGTRDKQKVALRGVMMGLKAAYTNIRRWLLGLWRELLELASKHRQTHINSG